MMILCRNNNDNGHGCHEENFPIAELNEMILFKEAFL